MSTLFDFDAGYLKDKGNLAGIDEAGRGPLAGPVVAAAVIFLQNSPLQGIDDSKKLTSKKRNDLYLAICARACVGIGVATEAEIDDINIYQATRLAMVRAVYDLSITPNYLLIDGNMKLDIPLGQEAIVKGDQKSASIAAASIIAKVYRDRWMQKLDEQYPQYCFKKNNGYPTKEHFDALKEHGVLPVHRTSFGPVREAMKDNVIIQH